MASSSFASAPFFRSLEQAVAWRESLRAQGRRLVFTNGVFDLLHAGHVRYLAQARALGDALVVCLNGDDSVRALKGPGRPLNALELRAELLGGLRSVDAVIGFEGERCDREIAALAPDVYAKGGDYTPESLNRQERAALDAAGTEIRILALVPGQSTSSLVRRMEGGAAAGRSPKPLRLGVLGSGSGSNFAALVDAIEAGRLDAEVALVISDVPDARILERAKLAGIPAVFVDPGPGRTRLDPAAQKEIRDRLVAAGVELVALAGFMRMVKPPLLDDFCGRILNIHPSLLPAFPGLRSWQQALSAGVAETGCTVHLVDAGMDTGPMLGRARVPVLASDDAASLHARIQQAEHALYPEVVGRWGRALREKGGDARAALAGWGSEGGE